MYKAVIQSLFSAVVNRQVTEIKLFIIQEAGNAESSFYSLVTL